MTLNCLGPHNTRHSAPLSPEAGGEMLSSHRSRSKENGIVIQIRYFKLNIGAELTVTGSPALSVHFIFLLAIWTLLMLGSDVSILIFTLRSCNTGTIVQLC